MQNDTVDGGRAFDWGRASLDYAKYRDIYPPEFYRPLLDRGLCSAGQRVLDLGTGTGVLPRALAPYGAEFIGVDSSENQITQARFLSEQADLPIQFQCAPAESCEFPDAFFDAVTACQCFSYFDHATLAPRLSRMLKPSGRFAALYMAWLPDEDPVAGRSEALVLKWNPMWTGCGEKRRPIAVPEAYLPYFEVECQLCFDLQVPFTRAGWNGRMRSCRGIGATLPEAEIACFEREHLALLAEIAPERFEVLHYAAITILRKR